MELEVEDLRVVGWWLGVLALSYLILTFLWNQLKREVTDIPTFTVPLLKVVGGKIPKDFKLGDDQFITYNPATLEVLGYAKVMRRDEVFERTKKARVAQESWKKTSFGERRRVLRTLLNFIVNNQEEILRITNLETGKTAVDSMMGEIFITCQKARWIIDNGERYLKREYRYPGALMLHKSVCIDYFPYGVMGIIIPWNFPFHNAISHILTALFTGNGAVVKVSEYASWSVVYLENLIRNLLTATGHNPDLIQFVTGYAECGQAVIHSTDKVLFIGSPQVGKKVMEAASATITPVTLELGGKDPFIICEDADLEYTTNMALRGAFLNCGQNCLSAERFYVYEKVYDQFIKKVLEITPQIIQGPKKEVDVGAINLPAQIQRYKEVINEAVSKGAKVLFGGNVNSSLEGHFFLPTVIVNVDHSMRIMREENFGPIMAIMKVRDDEEAIRLANDCNYALGCSIFSSNYDRAHKMAARIQAGMTAINDWGLSMGVQSLPCGGIKISGFGKFNGPEGLRDFCYQKSLVTDRFGFIVPPPSALFFPSPSTVHFFVQDFIYILHGRTIGDKFRGILNLLKKFIFKPKAE
jgi:acyl-CoA reductase-like NAD-dependent aldehyde dehydrogenase